MKGLYAIQNKVSGKRYIGSSNSIEKRFEDHILALRRGNHINPYLQHAWDKRREGAFILEVIELVGLEGDLLTREQIYLDEGFAANNLYNIARDARSPQRGRKRSEEAKRKTGESLKGHPYWGASRHSKETRKKISLATAGENNPMYGRHHTAEAKGKMSRANKGRMWSDERKREHSLAMSGENNPFWGKCHTAEARRRISEATTGRIAWNKGKPSPLRGVSLPDHVRRKISLGRKGIPAWNKGKRLSEEHRNNISKARGKEYPAFCNTETGDYIPAGVNLARICREAELHFGPMNSLARGLSKQTKDGWRLCQ